LQDWITPLIGAIFKGANFWDLSFELNGSTFRYGHFINELIVFMLVCLVLYCGVVLPLNKVGNKQQQKETAEQDVRQSASVSSCRRPSQACMHSELWLRLPRSNCSRLDATTRPLAALTALLSRSSWLMLSSGKPRNTCYEHHHVHQASCCACLSFCTPSAAAVCCVQAQGHHEGLPLLLGRDQHGEVAGVQQPLPNLVL
jgi:hypothetical protein